MNEKPKNLNQAILAAMDTYAKHTCFQVKQSGHYQNITYRRFQTLTFRMAHFFRSQGVTRGERVAIVTANSLEWMTAYIGCLLAGGVVVPLRASLPPGTLHFMLQDSGACLAIVKDTASGKVIKDAGEE